MAKDRKASKHAKASLKRSLSFVDRFKAACLEHGIDALDGAPTSLWSGPYPGYIKDFFNATPRPDAVQMRHWANACENYAVAIRDRLHQ